MIENIFQASSAEIDAEIARLRRQIGQLEHARAVARRAFIREEVSPSKLAEASAQLRELNGKLDVLRDLVNAYNAEYTRRGGWTRFYMVDNNNGHLHTHTHCSTCYDSTSFYWMTEMSGLTHAEAVELAGGLSCLSCFGELREIIEQNRPCQVETPNQARSREEREAAAAALAAKKAAAADKAITAADGSPLFDVTNTRDGGWRETSNVIKTAVAAQRKASQAAFDLYFYNVQHRANSGESHPQTAAWEELLRRCVEALAARDGKTVEGLRADIQKKVEAKYRREYKNSF